MRDISKNDSKDIFSAFFEGGGFFDQNFTIFASEILEI